MPSWSAEDRLAFDIAFALKRSKRIKRQREDDDPFGPIARHLRAQLRLAGWRFENVGTEAATVPLDAYRAAVDDARGALRMIRQAIEASAPAGILPPEEALEPTLLAEAEAIAAAVRELAGRAREGKI
jgi:hypothetical protein